MHYDARPDLIKPKDEPFNKEYFDSCLSNNKVKIFVCEQDGEILGHCITKTLEYTNHHIYYDMTILEIDDLCVDKKARGKNVGRQLFEKARAHAKEIGATRMELTVWGFNENARQFYEHLGMVEKVCRMEMLVN